MIIHAWNARRHGKAADICQEPSNGPCGCGGPITKVSDYGYWENGQWHPRCFSCYRGSTDYRVDRGEAPDHDAAQA